MMSNTPDIFARLSKYSIPHLLKPFSALKLQDEAMRSRLPSFFVQLALAPIRADSLPDMGIGG
jgi:hypothetical protein